MTEVGIPSMHGVMGASSIFLPVSVSSSEEIASISDFRTGPNDSLSISDNMVIKTAHLPDLDILSTDHLVNGQVREERVLYRRSLQVLANE